MCLAVPAIKGPGIVVVGLHTMAQVLGSCQCIWQRLCRNLIGVLWNVHVDEGSVVSVASSEMFVQKHVSVATRANANMS